MREILKRSLREARTAISEAKIVAPTYGWLLSHDNAAGMTGSIWQTLVSLNRTNPHLLGFFAGFVMLTTGAYLMQKPAEALGGLLGRGVQRLHRLG